MLSSCVLRARWGFLWHCHNPFRGLPALPNSTKEEPDNASRALTLLVHALFSEAYGDTEEPGLAITSGHHKASIAKEGGFTWLSRAC